MASYTLTIYDIPQIINKKYISISYNSNGEKSTCTIHTENRTWICTLQDLSYSKAIYKPGELIFKLQITGCSGVNAICSTFKGKKIELTAQADNKSSSIAKDYYIFGIQIEKKGNVYYATFQAYDPFKFLTLDTYCKAYTGKKFTQDIFLNKDLWPNNLPETIDEQLTIENAQSLKKEREAEKANLEEKQKEINKEINDLNDKINKETNENTKEKLQKTLNEKEALSQNISIRIQELDSEIKKLNSIINDGTKSQFNKNPRYLYYNDKEFIQPYLVQYNESFFDFLVRVSNRCGEFLYYEDGYFNIGWKKKTKKDKDSKEQDDITPITEYVSVNFSDETATAWKENYIVSSHHNYPLTENHIRRFPSLLPLDEEKLQKEYGKEYSIEDNGEKITITYKKHDKDSQKTTDETATATVNRSNYEISKDDLQLQDSHLASDENLVSLPPKDKYTKWKDFALWPGCYLINVFTDIVNSANMVEAITNVAFSTGATSASSKNSAVATNNDYEKEYFNNKNDIYKEERKNNGRIHPFSTSEVNKNTALNSYVTFSLEFYEAVRKGIEANERSRIQIALGDHFYPLALGSLIELDGEKYIVVQMNGCVNSGAEALDIEAIPYKEEKFVFPPAAPVSSIREAKAQRAFITHNTDPLKMNRVRVRYPWQGQTEDPTPWIRIALPMASDGSGFNFLPQIGDEAIINYENGNIEKPYVEGMLYTRAAEEDESTVPYAFKRDKARVISSVNGHSIIFSDPPASTNVFNGLIPTWKTLSSFVPTVFKEDLPDYNKKAMGGIELTDEHGLYSISMSSDKRAISIDSPLGKVDINAFTGITISAPNGNVRIEGKNIDIVAGNNLSISSGNNIDSAFWPFGEDNETNKDMAIEQLYGKLLLGTLLQPIDMKLIRTIMETFLRPIGGTMLIKSHRYLCIEAGKGKADILGRNVIKYRWSKKGEALDFAATGFGSAFSHHGKEILSEYFITDDVYQAVTTINSFIEDLFKKHKNTSKLIVEFKTNYNRLHNNLIQNQQLNALNLKNADTVINEAIAGTQYNNIDVNGLNLDAQINQEISQLNDLGKILYDTITYSEPGSVWDRTIRIRVPDKYRSFIDQTIRTEIEDHIINPVSIHNNQQNNIANDPAQTIEGKTIDVGARRNILSKILVEATTNLASQYITFQNIAPQQGAVFSDNRQWQNYVNGIAFTLPEGNWKGRKSFGDTAMKAYNIYELMDQYTWDNTQGGEILFSKEKGKILHFTNNGIEDYQQNYENRIKLQELKNFLLTK